ncbi:hypothetical protein [Reyranella sp.]|uniref:hypothetical protein n=1 Tax=Reyranella sp. TaxID=1929291 RepID=UPI003BAAFB1A
MIANEETLKAHRPDRPFRWWVVLLTVIVAGAAIWGIAELPGDRTAFFFSQSTTSKS